MQKNRVSEIQKGGVGINPRPTSGCPFPSLKEDNAQAAQKIRELKAECDRLKSDLSDLLELIGDAWLQWGYAVPDGGRYAGGLSTLEAIEAVLKERGIIDDQGRFEWEKS